MNLVNYEATGMAAAYDAVRAEVQRLGVEIASTEIVVWFRKKRSTGRLNISINWRTFPKIKSSNTGCSPARAGQGRGPRRGSPLGC